ncbi:hypothetical protein GCM10010371_01770 [Streptomyces subrutilus]|uniref:Rhomboid family intramembrane serine protease n=1 Tax=Streptomyces subrutilus TaxID=36818 RepID=A0A5P2UKY8_9ACTN|nr:hypothetical protein [Streptomyces subrutilus]QEU77297.1 hypothetical protein CP968_02440 [Streptomyces subrutilus]GGZ46293.1 hypothetical protein GCM10010371_01770 [Streptomyces subrutilus]
MGALVFNVTTAALMVLMFKGGQALSGEGALRGRRVPWTAVVLTGLALAGVALQLCWAGAMDALDGDPSRSGWWRVVTSVFVQNGGVFGGAWNIATLAVVAALADWFWGTPIALGLFLCGILLPEHIDALVGAGGHHSTDPRNFAGSSGATYFLGATLAAALLVRVVRAGRGGARSTEGLLAAGVPVLGLAMWCAQSNGHGLVAVYGFLLGAFTCLVARPSVPCPAPAGAPSGGGPAGSVP